MIYVTTPGNFSFNSTKAGDEIYSIHHTLATVFCNLHRPQVCLQQLHATSAHQDTLTSVLILLPVTKSKISHLVPPCEHQLPLQDLKCN